MASDGNDKTWLDEILLYWAGLKEVPYMAERSVLYSRVYFALKRGKASSSNVEKVIF